MLIHSFFLNQSAKLYKKGGNPKHWSGKIAHINLHFIFSLPERKIFPVQEKIIGEKGVFLQHIYYFD